MRRAILLSLFISLTVTKATINSTTHVTFQQQQLDWFMKFKDYKVIQEPSHPVFFEGRAFYWLGSYVPSPDHPQTCIILASHLEWPFDGAVFRNGTFPSAAVFGCNQGKMCRGTKCIEPLTHFNVVTYTLIAVVAFLLICLIAGEPRANKRNQEDDQEPPRMELYERPRRRSPREPSFESLFAPHENRLRFEGPPEYTE